MGMKDNDFFVKVAIFLRGEKQGHYNNTKGNIIYYTNIYTPVTLSEGWGEFPPLTNSPPNKILLYLSTHLP